MRHQTRLDTVQPKSTRSNNLICIDICLVEKKEIKEMKWKKKEEKFMRNKIKIEIVSLKKDYFFEII